MQLSSDKAEICIIGRCSFQSGIGSMTYAAAEMLSRSFPVSILPTEPELRGHKTIELPNGRVLSVCAEPDRMKVSFFCDVLWNGQHDYNYALAPAQSLKYAWLVWDSDELPARWTWLLNNHFDLVVATSPHLVAVARAAGVETPIATMPIPLDLEPLLAHGLQRPQPDRIRFGSVAAFHMRKGIDILLDAFLGRYQGRADVELLLHSNLAIGDTYEQIRRMVADRDADNVTISLGSLSTQEKDRLIRSIDIFVNCSRGEGYSIGPREALACGRTLVLSDVGGHQDLAGVPGVFLVPADVAFPARFPEIDNVVFGQQRSVRPKPVARALEQALDFVRSGQADATASSRRAYAQNFSFSRLSPYFAALIDPMIPWFRHPRIQPPDVSIPDEFWHAAQDRLGRRADRLTGARRQVCVAYDAGFFSIFNAFMSHLVWQQQEERCHAVLPDWDVDRLVRRLGDAPMMSFCYGQPGDGNIWLKLFEPLYGSTDAEMNDEAFLYRHASEPEDRHNARREPLMTYIHAYRLYQSRDFAAWRRQYHRLFVQHVRLRPVLAAEIDEFSRTHLRRPFMIAAHVRHPSHTVEQPNLAIAHTQAYVTAIREQLSRRGIAPESPDWGIFLATDQERVVRQFRDIFPGRVACHDDVRRTVAAEDAAFEALSAVERNQEGHQLQHLVARSRKNWNWRMAYEVVRDAYAMADCHVLLHVVSNVSTAVAYMNPELEMVFCSAEPAAAAA